MRKLILSFFAISNVIILGGCVVAYGPTVHNRSGQNIKVVAHTLENGQLADVTVSNELSVFLGGSHLELEHKISKIECFSADGSLLMSLSCYSNAFLNKETVVVIDD